MKKNDFISFGKWEELDDADGYVSSMAGIPIIKGTSDMTILFVTDKYCEKCGDGLVFEYRFVEFDSREGKRVYTVLGTCPRRKWYWTVGHSRGYVLRSGLKIRFVGEEEVSNNYPDIDI